MILDTPIKIGMLGFARNKSLVSRLARWFTRQEWSHIFVILELDADVGDHKIIEASWDGVTLTSMGRYRDKYVIEVCDMETPCREEGLRAVKELLGKKYGYAQLVGFIPVVLLRRMGINIKNPIIDGFVCSELAAHYLSAALDDSFWLTKAEEFTPGDIYRVVHILKEVTCLPLSADAH